MHWGYTLISLIYSLILVNFSLIIIQIIFTSVLMKRFRPYPNIKYPLPADYDWLCCLKDFIQNKDQITISEYTYLLGTNQHEFERNVLFTNNASSRLSIGKFNQIFGITKFLVNGNTTIGNDVWLGQHCIIMPGVEIGNGALITANSVISDRVEPYTIMDGYPAQPIGKRFDSATIKKLNEIKWWNWEIEKIINYATYIANGDVFSLA